MKGDSKMIDQTLDWALEGRIRQLVTGTPCRGLIGKISRLPFWGLPLVLLLTTGCASTTLFQSNFDATPINQPPAHTQAVGTATIEGSVVVATLPNTPSVRGVRFDPISSPNTLPRSIVPWCSIRPTAPMCFQPCCTSLRRAAAS